MLNKRILVLMFVVAFLLVGCLPDIAPSVTPPVTENQAPTITSVHIPTSATVGVAYTYDVEATDPDGDTLTYSLYVKPIGMTINSATGVIRWVPYSTQIGERSVTVEVSDGTLSDTQSFKIVVSGAEEEEEEFPGGGGYVPTPPVKLTEIVVLPDTMDLFVGKFGTFKVIAHYSDTTTKNVTNDNDCIYDSSYPSIASVVSDPFAIAQGWVKALDFGEATITITYTEDSIPKKATIAVTVGRVTIVIDGVLSPGEWYGATVIPVGDYKGDFYDMGTVKVLATTDYLYVAFDVKDSTDARLGDGRIDDNLGININPTVGGSWGMPCDIIFGTGLYLDQGYEDWISSGLTDDYETQWSVNGTQYDIPDDLDTVTLYSNDMRVSEWKVPLDTISPASGDVLKVGGHVNIEISYRYPQGLDWADVSTYEDIIVQ